MIRFNHVHSRFFSDGEKQIMSPWPDFAIWDQRSHIAGLAVVTVDRQKHGRPTSSVFTMDS